MRKIITRVTVTGADDSVCPSELIRIAEEFPFVEFGILLSRNSMGRNRFPSAGWLNRLVNTTEGLDFDVAFAGHICGSLVKEILLGQWPAKEFTEIHPGFTGVFERWQLNTHAQPHEINYDAFSQILMGAEYLKQSVIFQYDNANTDLVKYAIQQGHKNTSALYDLSHGAGVLPKFWPRPIPAFPCGYAGGLSPENVAEQLTNLEVLVGDTSIWIDAETRLRSSDDSIFDLAKVRSFLKAAKPWVVVESL